METIAIIALIIMIEIIGRSEARPGKEKIGKLSIAGPLVEANDFQNCLLDRFCDV
jgi:hypothetical protein